MRRIVPDSISKIADKITPYLTLNRETMRYVLKENAPEEIVQAKRIYDEWFAKNQ